MSRDRITLSHVIPAAPGRIFEAWLDSDEHAAMTGGGGAAAEPRVGAAFSAWDGYISGRNLELEPVRRIVQSWRTSDFAEGDPDSRLEVLLEEVEAGTRVTLVHTGLPQGTGETYEAGWKEFYFAPMETHFGGEPA